MREIKFRAWDVDKKQMSAPFTLDDITKDYDCDYYAGVEDFAPLGCTSQKNTTVVMQYTGLKDKNGVEIYEGDIVHWDGDEYYSEETGFVIFENGTFCMAHYPRKDKPDYTETIEVYSSGTYDHYSLETVWKGDIKVIGNKHQHPELLNT